MKLIFWMSAVVLLNLPAFARAGTNEIEGRIAKSVECHIKVDDGITSHELVKRVQLIANDEGGLSQADITKIGSYTVSAYSSTYRLDCGSRLFLEAGDVVVSAETNQESVATLTFTQTGVANYAYTCKFKY